ncbi:MULTISPECIES: sodium/solute symporter [unclassified Chitinophaga]|uniref:sodium:solute symporter family transporter n=1 Tax=unclassified Chitinophaga TaxID=2619133 RepID=UPI0009D01E52|nr:MULTISPECIES: sodium/solute symporter [unclassified Chitinophaga]OMP78687.1 sodium transporter [[Flexibacter] sp. ATCC 35208]WPV64929.1 sodium/solute symporter [Chitinophaga sp. LS1]
MNKLANIDYIIFVIYFLVVASYGYWIYLRKKKATMSTKDFFLAEGSLTWWAIGASLIASNISAEQFIGMSGNGFSVGIAVSAYEWIAAVALIIVAVWFIPVYLKNKIYTMPQFLKTRYNETVALIMAVFWLFLYVFVNLTSILFLGALAINNLVGAEHFHIIMVALAIFALVITLGGMKVIGYTDVIQVIVLIIGGLATTWLALTMVSEHFGLGKDALAGFNALMKDSPDHFEMILKKPGPGASQEYINRYLLLPGITIYFAGQWIINLNYWGCNQYITQRALGADLKTARNGILFAGLMKLMMPVIVMLPGIAAYVLYKNGGLQGEMAPGGQFNADNAYSAVLTFLPNGLKGLSLAALTAAIVASLAGKANSISTIFTLDVYKKYINKEADEKKLVWTGRLTIVVAMLVAIAFTWNDLLGIGGAGGFTFIQKYTGFISPGVFAMFLLGMFWKRTTGAAAVAGIVTGFLLSVVFNNYAAEWFGHETWLYTAFLNSKGVYEIPFQICMGWAFFFTLLVMVILSLAGPAINPKAFQLDKAMFKLAPSTIVMIVITLLILSALYIRFW